MTTPASNRMLGLALTTAISGVMLTGCAGGKAPPAAHSASQAQVQLAKGKPSRAIENAEAAVLADPRNAEYRAILGSAYLDAGRFASAATTFDDAMKLGDTSARTALSLALALAGTGKQVEAVELLNRHQGSIAKSDLGLAFSLSGYPERGIAILSDAIRSGENTAKTRQNLAYSYALAGRWKEARLMAAEDVPADQVSDRIAEWAEQVDPGLFQTRIAGLLGVPAGAKDVGQPLALALNNNPSVEQLAAEATAPAPVTGELAPIERVEVAASAPAMAPAGELPPVGDAPAPRADGFASAFAAVPTQSPAPVRTAAPRAVAAVNTDASAFTKPAPAKAAKASRPAQSQNAMARAAASEGTHLIQLGSFSSQAGAKRAWDIYLKRYPQLAAHDMVISEAVVGGKRYWRVSAGGFDRTTSRSMCNQVKNSGASCLAWTSSRPLPGAVDRAVQMAMR